MDNFYMQCPPMMSDGRLFTDYRTNVRTNEHIKYVNNIERNDDYRVFLQDNGAKILDDQWCVMKNFKCCNNNNCVHIYPTRMNPALFAQERKAVDALNTKNSPNFKCPKLNDYRATNTQS